MSRTQSKVKVLHGSERERSMDEEKVQHENEGELGCTSGFISSHPAACKGSLQISGSPPRTKQRRQLRVQMS